MAELTESQSRAAVTVLWVTGADAQTATDLLRAEVGRVTATAAMHVELSRSCRRCGSSEHGQPVVLPDGEERPPFVSLSRAGITAAVAVSQCGPVGVDVERPDAARFAGFDDVALHEREVAPSVEDRAVTWVRKESLLKATGAGLHVDPRLVRLSDPGTPPRLVEWSAPNPPQRAVWMHDVDVEGHVACVSVLSDEAPRVTVRQASPAGLSR